MGESMNYIKVINFMFMILHTLSILAIGFIVFMMLPVVLRICLSVFSFSFIGYYATRVET